MAAYRNVGKIAGLVLHVLVGGLMIFAGSGKVFGFAPPQIVEGMAKYGLSGQLRVIGAGEMISAVLLLIPLTSRPGLLLTSAFWGGVICIHMAHGESYVPASVLLLLTWLGAYLRDPSTLGRLAVVARAEDAREVARTTA
jgi:hypothetical protein